MLSEVITSLSIDDVDQLINLGLANLFASWYITQHLDYDMNCILEFSLRRIISDYSLKSYSFYCVNADHQKVSANSSIYRIGHCHKISNLEILPNNP